jgi:hypothetical protein
VQLINKSISENKHEIQNTKIRHRNCISIIEYNMIEKQKITYFVSPSSRVACSSGVQSRDMPGLCFMFTTRPEELSGTELPLKEEGLT